jgi:hypothetical protein
VEGFKFRYLKEALDAKVVLEEKKAALETHHWIIQTSRNALQDNEWKDFCDPGAPQEVVVPKQQGSKGKSDLAEYEQVVEKKSRQTGERGPDGEEEIAFFNP